MSNHGDDCYFFYYSTCSKGDSCPFRHCEAAMGNEIVCSLWLEGRCFRSTCKFRHMEITKKRKEIPCYWENQAAGCQKPHCAFFHDRPRYIDGMYVPADKSLSQNVEQLNEEPAPPPAAPLPTAANPQIRSVIKTEAQEPVPSPTHPPVVINPADDDEDEDDQFSEEGDDGKVGVSPRKISKTDDSLNFGVSTLEEIRLRKALKASLKRAGYPLQNADTSANREKENFHSFFGPALNEARDGPLIFEDAVRPRGRVAERLGRRMFSTDEEYGEGVPLKRSLVERLGRVVDVEEPTQKALKPIKERLGLSARSVASQSVETKMESNKAPEEIRIKTLEEIKLEKAAKSQPLSKDSPSVGVQETNNTTTTKGVKRAISIKDHPINHVKTFSEILHEKKKRQEEENQDKHTAEKAPSKSQGESDSAGPRPEATNLGEVRVKTLEEIRREKAARIQAQQASETENKKSSDAEESVAKRPCLLRINKLASQTEKSDDGSEKPVKSHNAPPKISVANGNDVKVKTFEEIMREKRLRKQEMEEKARGLAEAEPCQKQPPEGTLKKVPARVSLTPPGSSSPSSTSLAPDTTVSTQRVPVRKLIPLKSRAASPRTSSTTPGTIDAASVKQSVSPPESSSQSPTGSREVPKKNTRKSGSRPSPVKQTRAASQTPAAEGQTADRTLSNSQKKSPDNTTNTKVRPKLNVKPSVVKPAAHVKPGQKRRGVGRSAVAAVKPLNSASTVLEEPLQETACRDRQVFPSSGAEAQLSSAVPHSPGTLLDSSSSPLSEELQTVPVFKQSLGLESKPTVSVAADRETSPVAQSPVLKNPTLPKSRRTSATGSRTTSASSAAASASASAVDVFEELINEFTDEHLQDEDVDPEMGEDDLLQELSEMIDS